MITAIVILSILCIALIIKIISQKFQLQDWKHERLDSLNHENWKLTCERDENIDALGRLLHASREERLTFQRFQDASEERHHKLFGSDCEDWEAPHWLMALTGEVGELANMLKKHERGDDNPPSKEEMAKELADIISYTVLTATYLGINVEEAVKQKFNEVTHKRGAKLKANVSDFLL